MAASPQILRPSESADAEASFEPGETVGHVSGKRYVIISIDPPGGSEWLRRARVYEADKTSSRTVSVALSKLRRIAKCGSGSDGPREWVRDSYVERPPSDREINRPGPDER